MPPADSRLTSSASCIGENSPSSSVVTGERCAVSGTTRPIVCRTTGSTSGIARTPAGRWWATSQVCAVTPGRPVRAWAISVATEFVSTAGSGTAPAAANAALTMRRCCMSSVSRHSGRVAASDHETVTAVASGPSAALSRR